MENQIDIQTNEQQQKLSGGTGAKEAIGVAAKMMAHEILPSEITTFIDGFEAGNQKGGGSGTEDTGMYAAELARTKAELGKVRGELAALTAKQGVVGDEGFEPPTSSV